MEISNQQPCNGCAYASFITGGYFCNRGQMFVPFGYVGCKLTDDIREAIEEERGMSEYTYEDVIIDPEDPRVEIGMKYYRADFPKRVLNIANNDEDYFGTLESIDTESPETPFVVKTGSTYSLSWACLIRKKESSYAERQEKWIAENHIKEDNEVQIIRKADSKEDGWGSWWNKSMDEAVGKVGRVYLCTKVHGIEVNVPGVGLYFYPYFVLKKVKQKYVPFDLSKEEDRTRLRDAWLKLKEHSNEVMVKAIYPFFNKVSIDNEEVFPDFLLENYEFLDGTPCGKLEVVEE